MVVVVPRRGGEFLARRRLVVLVPSKAIHLQHEHEHECSEECDHDEEFTEIGESIGGEEE